MKATILFVCLFAVFLAPVRAEEAPRIEPDLVTVEQLHAAQQAWCEGLLSISRAHREGGDYRAVAERVIDGAYNYAVAPVLFKPTLAHGAHTFRTTRAGALSYFVGGDADYPEDTGFALKGWTAATVRIAATYIEGPLGIAMGHITFTDASGREVAVEKTFVFRRGDDGVLRIVVHNSSLSYAPAK